MPTSVLERQPTSAVVAVAAATTGPLRRHWVLLTLLVAGIALRVVVQLAYQPALIYIDSFRYLDQLGSLDPTGLDPVGYTLFVLYPTMPFGGLATVAAVQHLSALAMAVAIYALLVRRGARTWLAALATAPVLLDAYQLQIEQNLMADEPFQFLLVALLVVLTWRQRPGPVASATAGLLAAIMLTVRLVAISVAVPMLVYLLLVAGPLRDRLAWKRRASTIGAMLAGLAVGLTCYAGYFHSWTGQWGVSTAHTSSLYGRTAVVADCAHIRLTPAQRQLCPKEPPGNRPGPDYYSHSPRSPVADLLRAGAPGVEVSRLVSQFNGHVLRQQPLDVIGYTLVDFAKSFRWARTDAYGDVPVSRWHFQTTYPIFAKNPYNPNPDVLPRILRDDGYTSPVVVTPLAEFLRGYQLSVGYVPGPILAAALLAGIAGIFVPKRRRAALRWPCLLVSGLAITLLGTAAVVEFSWRYQLPLLVLLPVAGVLGITAWQRPSKSGPSKSGPCESGPCESGPSGSPPGTPA